MPCQIKIGVRLSCQRTSIKGGGNGKNAFQRVCGRKEAEVSKKGN